MKLSHIAMETDQYLIQCGNKGLVLTKMCGSGDEKDCDIELTWDEIFELRYGWTLTPVYAPAKPTEPTSNAGLVENQS